MVKCIQMSVSMQIDIIKCSLNSHAIKAFGRYVPKRGILLYVVCVLLVLLVKQFRSLMFELMWYPLLYVKVVNLVRIGIHLGKGYST